MTGHIEDSVIDIYRRHGSVWAQHRGDRLPEQAWLDHFCSLLPACGAVLDIGCGSGVPLARELSGRGFRVTGTDGASTMLALFQRNLPGAPSRLADMRQLDLGQQFAGLLAWDSLFHLSPDDQRAMFARFRAHATPGAALMFTSGNTEGDAIGVLEGEPLYHGSLGPNEYRDLLHVNGFGVVRHVAEDPSCGHRTVWLAHRLE